MNRIDKILEICLKAKKIDEWEYCDDMSHTELPWALEKLKEARELLKEVDIFITYGDFADRNKQLLVELEDEE